MNKTYNATQKVDKTTFDNRRTLRYYKYSLEQGR